MKILLRSIILVVSVTIAILGASLLSVGVVWMDMERKYEAATEKSTIYIGAVLIVLGIILAFTTILACYAVITKSYWLLNITGFLNIILFIVYGDYGIIAFQLKKDTSHLITDIRTELELAFNKTSKNTVQFYDHLHQRLQCCGLDGPKDFQIIHNKTYPPSCCKDYKNCTQPSYTQGCADQLKNYVKEKFVLSGSISLAIAFLNIITSIVAYVAKQKKVTFPE